MFLCLRLEQDSESESYTLGMMDYNHKISLSWLVIDTLVVCTISKSPSALSWCTLQQLCSKLRKSIAGNICVLSWLDINSSFLVRRVMMTMNCTAVLTLLPVHPICAESFVHAVTLYASNITVALP